MIGVTGGLAGAVAGRVAGTMSGAATALRTVIGAGLARPVRPDRLLWAGVAFARWRITPATGWAMGAALDADRPALVDERGSLTFAELDAAATGIAAGLIELGVGDGDMVAVLVRNSRWTALTLSALAKIGADALLCNTGSAAPELSGVLGRHRIAALIHDAQFVDVVAELEGTAADVPRVLAWTDGDPADPEQADDDRSTDGVLTLAELSRRTGPIPLRPAHIGREVLLTSGTTGGPKASRRGIDGPEPAIALLSSIPFRARETTVIACPLFHGWGLVNLGLGLLLSSTLVVRRRFDPEETLRLIAEHRATALVAVPVMLQRILDLPPEVRARYDLSRLRVVAVSGSPLSADLATRFMDAFGEVVYDLYGSTEVAFVSIAGPRDLREAPGTVGRPPFGTTVRLVDQAGRDVPPGTVGRVFAGSSLVFGGYTSGEDKQRLDGLVSTGDLGHVDENGRLFLDGREDDMIISGGENVYPIAVERLLAGLDGIREAAVVGVPDAELGQRLAAYVVPVDGVRPDPDAIREAVRTGLGRYQVPRDVHVVAELPRNATGKVLTRHLTRARR